MTETTTTAAKTNDGGPAFPVTEYSNYANTTDNNFLPVADQSAGMTLRDYFAAKAMPVVLEKWHGKGANTGWDAEGNPAHIARICYEFADEMLAARNK